MPAVGPSSEYPAAYAAASFAVQTAVSAATRSATASVWLDDAPVEATLARAEQAATRAISLDSSLAEAYSALGYAYHWQWRWEDMSNASDFVTLARGTGGAADRAAALAVLDRWKRGRNPQWPWMAIYYSLLGERDQVIEALERGLAARSPGMTSVNVVPWLDPVRGDPRFTRIVRAMHFP